MRSHHKKAAFVGAWTLAVAGLAYISGTTSLTGWAVVALVLVTPPIVIMRFWRVPAASMSERIQEALR